jgi:8-oxo-dGTP pyrophosphatase MutT (NUDIX family)
VSDVRRSAGTAARRRQYFHDRTAPTAHALLPAAFAVVRDAAGRVLLVRRADDGNWELPGGRIDVGESAAATVVREVAEEAGLTVRVTGVAGIYSDPGHVLAYPDGEVRQQVALCFHAIAAGGGDPRADGRETVAASWFQPEDTADLAMHPTMRGRLLNALADPDAVHFE